MNLGKALAVGVIEEDTVLLTGPDSIGFDHARPLYLKEQAARPARSFNHRLMHRRLCRIKLIVGAQGIANVIAESIQGGQTNNAVHASYGASGTKDGEQ